MKRKILCSLLIMAAVSFGISAKAYAAVNGYIIKNGDITYQYGKQELVESFLDYTEGQDATLYTNFKENVQGRGIYLFYDDEGKYVDFKEIEEAFIQKTDSKENFDLNDEIKKANKADAPALIENIKVESKSIVKDLIIAKEGMEFDGAELLKDKYKKIYIKANNVSISNIETEGDIVVDPGIAGKVQLSNIKCKNIDILSGEEKGIQFDKVESTSTKIKDGLEIEIQNKDEVQVPPVGGNTPSQGNGDNSSGEIDKAEQEAMLKKAQSDLNTAMSKISNEKEKEIVSRISNSINSIVNDESYNFQSDIDQVKSLYNNLSTEEKNEFQQVMLENVNLENVYKLMTMYGLD
ncbi:MAG: hypothetical protein AAGU01_08505 [Clostridiaceae bacterium]